MNTKPQYQVALFGLGVVGQGFYNLLQASQNPDIAIQYVVVKSKTKKRSVPQNLLVYDPATVWEDAQINLVVEATNDAQAGYEIIRNALLKRIPVVSASKKAIAQKLEDLVRLSRQTNTPFLYEAAVAASIPVLQTLDRYFAYEKPVAVGGILNGTTNYILSRIEQDGLSFNEALQLAQQAGFAEADPSSDVDGWDAAYKLTLLNLHGFGVLNDPNEVLRFSIRNLSRADRELALLEGKSIRLVARSIQTRKGLASWVLPTLVPVGEGLGTIVQENNALQFDFPFNGPWFTSGKGAGSLPTGSAVLKDVQRLVAENYSYRYTHLPVLSLSPLADDVSLELLLAGADDDFPADFRLAGWRRFTDPSGRVVRRGWVVLPELKKWVVKLEEAGVSLLFTGAFQLHESRREARPELRLKQEAINKLV